MPPPCYEPDGAYLFESQHNGEYMGDNTYYLVNDGERVAAATGGSISSSKLNSSSLMIIKVKSDSTDASGYNYSAHVIWEYDLGLSMGVYGDFDKLFTGNALAAYWNGEWCVRGVVCGAWCAHSTLFVALPISTSRFTHSDSSELHRTVLVVVRARRTLLLVSNEVHPLVKLTPLSPFPDGRNTPDIDAQAFIEELTMDKQVAWSCHIFGNNSAKDLNPSHGWRLYSAERFYERPTISHIACEEEDETAKVKFNVHNNFRENNLKPGEWC